MKKVKAAHVYIVERSIPEMEALRDSEPDEGLRAAYGEMLDGMRKNPRKGFWYCDWAICLRDGTLVGGIGFKGAPDKEGRVELGYGINETYRRHGYAYEAVCAMAQWALLQWGVKSVWAQTEPDNAASQALLLKCGFVPDGEGEEGPMFRYAPKSEAGISTFLPIGMCLGASFGILFDNLALGISFGLCLGLCFGAALQSKHAKEKQSDVAEKKTTLCYLERDGQYLMLHRTKKENDENGGKWIGVGGKIEPGETPEDGMLREVREETGLTLTAWRARGIVHFLSDVWENEDMYLYTATEWTGEQRDCDEGELAWVDKQAVFDLPLWEGDKIFLRRLDEDEVFFDLTLRYQGEELKEAKRNGENLPL